MLTDKATVQQVLGCLMKHPQFLSEVDKYSLNITDFNSRFEKAIFGAIYEIYYNDGVIDIKPVDIDIHLQSNDVAHGIFEKQHGLEYLQDVIEFSNVESFNSNYNRLKKLNLLRDLKKQGIDISDFYVEDLTSAAANEINSKFESLTTVDIIEGLKKKLLKLESTYAKSDEVQVENIAEDIDEFVTSLVETSEIGHPIQGDIYNQVISGAQKGALTIRSGSSGLGKTRQAVGDACYLAYPLRYDWASCKWVQCGGNEKVLFIVTEQTFKQVKKMILAYLTGINESKFKFGQFTQLEWKVINAAQEIIKKYKDNFILVKIPNPNIELVKTLIRENVLINDIGYVFYDYIFIGPSLLNEFRGFALRNDKLLSYI